MKYNTVDPILGDVQQHGLAWFEALRDLAQRIRLYIPPIEEYEMNRDVGRYPPPTCLDIHSKHLSALLQHDHVVSSSFREVYRDLFALAPNGYGILYRILSLLLPQLNPHLTFEPPVFTHGPLEHIKALGQYL